MTVSNLTFPASPMGLKPPAESVDSTVKGASGPEKSAEQEKLKNACKDFEAVFLNFLLGQMRETVPKSDLMGNSQGETLYRSMLDQEHSKQMADSGGIGLAEMLYRQFSERG